MRKENVNHSVKKNLIVFFLVIGMGLFEAQTLTKKQTIDYINYNMKDKITVDEVGNITVVNKARFFYKNVTVVNKPNVNQRLEFICNKQDNCIESLDGDQKRKQFSYFIVIDNQQTYLKLINAFEYLIRLLEKEKPELKDSDPFAPHNYKKN